MSKAQFHNPQNQISGHDHYHQSFTYDGLSRLKSADYGDGSSGSSTYFDVAGLAYDKVGNITGLQRNDETGSLIDDLGYSYQSGSNRLGSISDAAGQPTSWDAADATFGYDANGNLTSQSDKLDNIAYDHRNLPTQFALSSGDTVIANYNADGQRILKELKNGSWQFYVMDGEQTLAVIDQSGFSHFNLVGNGTFGRYTDSGARRYYIKDHLGSMRAVVDDTGNVLETFDYYPFGLLMPKRNTAGANTIEKYTEHELDDEAGLNAYYMVSRYYDPATGQFWSTDPILGEQGPKELLQTEPRLLTTTPYGYVFGNPTNLADPDGRCPSCLEQLKTIFSYDETYLGDLFRADQQGQLEQKITVDAIDAGIATGESVGDLFENTADAAFLAAGPTEGATLPIAGVAQVLSITSDAGVGALETQKAKIMGTSYDEAISKGVEIGVDVVTNSATKNLAKNFVKETGFATGPAFRSSANGRFVTNIQGYSAAYGIPAAVGLAIKDEIQMFFDNLIQD